MPQISRSGGTQTIQEFASPAHQSAELSSAIVENVATSSRAPISRRSSFSGEGRTLSGRPAYARRSSLDSINGGPENPNPQSGSLTKHEDGILHSTITGDLSSGRKIVFDHGSTAGSPGDPYPTSSSRIKHEEGVTRDMIGQDALAVDGKPNFRGVGRSLSGRLLTPTGQKSSLQELTFNFTKASKSLQDERPSETIKQIGLQAVLDRVCQNSGAYMARFLHGLINAGESMGSRMLGTKIDEKFFWSLFHK